ncbi:MAG: hypothetical protein AB1505_30525 [Candidatus Latescibacterota bacterium]
MAIAVHVTHEAVHQSGGIGAVLRGLLTSRAYGSRVQRTILLGPLPAGAGGAPLGPDGALLFDSREGAAQVPGTEGLASVAADFGVRLLYGWRRLRGESGEAAPEVVLVDVSREPAGLGEFKYFVYERYRLDSRRYEGQGEYEAYMRLAEPGFEAVRALLGDTHDVVWLISHDFMGLPAVFKCQLAGDARFRTVFYAHEVATARLLVEEGPGRDFRFYNVLRRARQAGGYISDFFGQRDDYYKHALICRAWVCHGVLAVGDWVVEELRFLAPQFAGRRIDLAYNGIPAPAVSPVEREESRARLRRYAASLLGEEPELVFTHVTRLVVSKGVWRDLLVLGRLDRRLQAQGRRAVCFLLATETGRRLPEAVERMAGAYDWPLVHREGAPDLAPRELELDLQVRAFNARSRAVKVVFVNQFGWDAPSCGPAMPAQMGFADLRRGTDLEFGQSLYEPFGIALLEPLACGALCVVSDVCGCLGLVQRSAAAGEPDPGRGVPGVVEAAYTRLPEGVGLGEVLDMGAAQAAQAEDQESRRLARILAERLPARPRGRQTLLQQGSELARRMTWERVAEEMVLPALERL